MKEKTSYLIIALAAGILFIICIPVVQAEGYIIQPAYGLVPEPTEDTSKEVSFFELTPRAMIIFIALSFSPILVYPVEFFLMLKIFIYLGYRKIDEMTVFYNSNRRIIYAAIAKNPGISFIALMSLTGVNRGVLQHHIHILELKIKIIRCRTAMSEGYFENCTGWSDVDKCFFIDLRNTTTRKILEVVSESTEISRKEIARILGITGPSVTWHTNRLSQDGIITITRDGRDTRISLSREAEKIIRRYPTVLLKPSSADYRRIDPPA
jgi:predicted transcriptional regulator